MIKKLAIVALALLFVASVAEAGAKKFTFGDSEWIAAGSKVHAPLKTAQPKGWSADNEYFTGLEGGNIRYSWTGSSFHGTLKLDGFKQAGPYAFTVNSQGIGSDSMADITDCEFWETFADAYGKTFVGGDNGCWNGEPYVDVLLVTLTQTGQDGDGNPIYGGSSTFDVPFPIGDYDIKFFVKLDWHVAGVYNNIMLFNDMTGVAKEGKCVQPKGFPHDPDFVISDPVFTSEFTKVCLVLKDGDPSWNVISGPNRIDAGTNPENPYGMLTYVPKGPKFLYKFVVAEGLDSSASYTLVQYNDPWAGSPAEDIATIVTDSGGGASVPWSYHEFNRDLASGTAKMWFVHSGYVNPVTDVMNGFNRATFLLEETWIVYDDTDVP